MLKNRWVRRFIFGMLGLVAGTALLAAGLWWYFHPQFQRVDKIPYMQAKGRELTFDILRPPQTNGLGILVMVSGKWKSSEEGIRPYLMAPLLRRGYTIFAVRHGSQPEYTVMEIVDEVRRAVRFIRRNAAEFGIDPGHLGVTGGSSGGHLSLMLAVGGDAGRPEAKDPVDQTSCAIQAVACFYPVTDLLNLGSSTENPGDGGPPRSFVQAFGPDSTNMAKWKIIGREMSPIFHVGSNLPPTLIYHGGADTLVPLDQSERFVQRARELGRPVELVVRPGKKHGWLGMLWDIRQFGQWFDRWLKEPLGR